LCVLLSHYLVAAVCVNFEVVVPLFSNSDT
jgi:hypothetical protein